MKSTDKAALILRQPVARRLLISSSLVLAARPTHAWPTRPIRVIVPYEPGGGTDSFTRLLCAALASELGQPIIVENRPGANGIIGSEVVMRAEPDGHTLLVAVNTHVINRYIMRSVPFNPVTDFTPIMRLCRVVILLVAGPRAGFRTVSEMLEAARARPGAVTLGHSTAATAYSTMRLGRLAGVELLGVPYRGGGPLLTDLIAGNIMTALTSTGSAMGHIRAGRIHALAVTTPNRSVLLPEVPTVSEAAVPGFEHDGWYGLFGPRNLPTEITDRLIAAIDRVITEPSLRERLLNLGGDLDTLPGGQFAALLEDEDKHWGRAAAEGLIRRE